MYAYKEIIENKADIIRVTKLLNQLSDQKIEVTIVPLSVKSQTKPISLFGALNKYQNQKKKKRKSIAWQQVIDQKYNIN